MNKSLLFLMIIVFGFTFAAKEKVRSLCDDPYIYAADRLPNGTVRVYRGDYYWDLTGLPDRVAKVNGPFKIWYKYMAPVTRNTSIMTIPNGFLAGNTWKFEGDRKWQWNPQGQLEIGGKMGAEWNEIPKGGFHCAMNDGDEDKKGFPRMIALKSLRAYYWKTSEKIFKPDGDVYNGFINGQFKEEFPVDITACTTFKSQESSVKYYVYLFKVKEHCFRPITGEEKCKEWRKNSELFGCTGNSGSSNTDSGSETGSGSASGGGSDGGSGGSSGSSGSGSGGSSGSESGKGSGNPSKVTSLPQWEAPNEQEDPSESGAYVSTSQKLLILFAFYSFIYFQSKH